MATPIPKRASNASDYLLVSRIRCVHCGKAFVGTVAHGKRHRYPYYVCFWCRSDPVPARKRLIHTLVHEIRVESRDMIAPGVPGARRAASGTWQGCSDNGFGRWA